MHKRSSLLCFGHFCPRDIPCNQPKLLQRRFQIFNNLLCNHIRRRQVIGISKRSIFSLACASWFCTGLMQQSSFGYANGNLYHWCALQAKNPRKSSPVLGFIVRDSNAITFSPDVFSSAMPRTKRWSKVTGAAATLKRERWECHWISAWPESSRPFQQILRCSLTLVLM